VFPFVLSDNRHCFCRAFLKCHTFVRRFAEARSPSGDDTDMFSGGDGGSGNARGSTNSTHSGSANRSANRRSRVLFDAFNLEAASDEVDEAQGRGSYDADKRPAKVMVFRLVWQKRCSRFCFREY
jgi:hypothetical protein